MVYVYIVKHNYRLGGVLFTIWYIVKHNYRLGGVLFTIWYIVKHNYRLGGVLFTACKAQLHVSATHHAQPRLKDTAVMTWSP